MRSIKIAYKGADTEITFNALNRAVNAFTRALVRAVRNELKVQDKVASGKLYNSVRPNVEVQGNEILVGLKFNDAPYWEYVEQGVQGAASKDKAPNSPFKFGSGTGKKGGLIPAIDKWTILKNIKGTRDALGRFVPRKQLVRSISRSIYLTGIRPTDFIDTPFDRTLRRYNQKLTDALASDVLEALVELIPEDMEINVTWHTP